MKLLFCKNCQDVIRLFEDEVRTCRCGNTSGKYINASDAIFSGESAIPLGFNNNTLRGAILKQPIRGMGSDFNAFVISKECLTFKKVGKI